MIAAASFFQAADLTGRVALITGAGGYLGRLIIETLTSLGCDVAALDRPGVDFSILEPASHGRRVVPYPVDLEQSDDVVAVPGSIVETFGRLDVLINAAAMVGDTRASGWAVRFEDQQAVTWRRALETNLTAPFLLAQAASAALQASGSGAILNIGSVYGVVAPDFRYYAGTELGNPAAYAASKGGLLQLTRWLSTAMAPSVRVNMISLGGIARGQSPEFRERYEARVPLGRMATEQDMMGAVVYFVSDLSRYVTGQNLMIDGGYTAW